MQGLRVIGLVSAVAIACTACGAGRHSAGRPPTTPLAKQIRAELRKPSVITGASAARTAEVYGPASHSAIEKASSPGFVSESHVAGAWYLIVMHGHFGFNGPLPPGAKAPRGTIAMEVWSPRTHTGTGYSVGTRVPKAVSRLEGPTVIDLG